MYVHICAGTRSRCRGQDEGVDGSRCRQKSGRRPAVSQRRHMSSTQTQARLPAHTPRRTAKPDTRKTHEEAPAGGLQGQSFSAPFSQSPRRHPRTRAMRGLARCRSDTCMTQSALRITKRITNHSLAADEVVQWNESSYSGASNQGLSMDGSIPSSTGGAKETGDSG